MLYYLYLFYYRLSIARSLINKQLWNVSKLYEFDELQDARSTLQTSSAPVRKACHLRPKHGARDTRRRRITARLPTSTSASVTFTRRDGWTRTPSVLARRAANQKPKLGRRDSRKSQHWGRSRQSRPSTTSWAKSAANWVPRRHSSQLNETIRALLNLVTVAGWNAVCTFCWIWYIYIQF